MNFLDENGLRRLWTQIIIKLNSKVPDGGTTGQVLKKQRPEQSGQMRHRRSQSLKQPHYLKETEQAALQQ